MKRTVEQRQHPRFACSGFAQVHPPEATEEIHAKILNLSLEGCLLDLATPLSPNEDIVDLTFTVNQLPFRVRGHVQYIRAETKIGLHFMVLSARARGQLVDLLAELSEEEATRKAEEARMAS